MSGPEAARGRARDVAGWLRVLHAASRRTLDRLPDGGGEAHRRRQPLGRPAAEVEPAQRRVASSSRPTADQAQAGSQAFLTGTLSRKSYEVLGGIGTLFQSVDRSVTTGKAPEAPRSSAAVNTPRQVAMP